MVKRDIEDLNLVAFDETSAPSLRVFPHQRPDGTAHEGRNKTQPNLRPAGDFDKKHSPALRATKGQEAGFAPVFCFFSFCYYRMSEQRLT
jgi:hypothetical protein